ncbi:MAG: hypothetical protein JNM40_16340 [Myxococcales bacterium]|nr:hypothetical protein [Myxococcales bacterium]
MKQRSAGYVSAWAGAVLFVASSLIGCSEPTSKCGSGLSECNNECISDKTDPNNCGGCGSACAEPLVCSSGKCSDSCEGAQVACGRACVELASDPLNCGKCGVKCENGATCVDKKCVGGNQPECMNRIPFATSGSYDVDAKVVQVSGKLTKNGAMVPDGTYRGNLVFENKAGGSRAMASFKDTGDATYQGSLFAGTYDVYYQPSSYCSTSSVLPCQRFLIREDVQLTVSGALDFDVKTVQLSGKLTKNGATVPDSSYRGNLVFENKAGGSRAMPSFKDTGDATYQGEIFAGTYDIRYQNSTYCNDRSALPCQSLVIRTGVNLTTSGALDFDVKTVQLSGRVTKNGASVPDGSYRGSLVFELKQGSSRAMASFKDSGEATYQGEVFVGTYDVIYSRSSYCSSGGVLPCGNLRLRSGLAVTTSGALDFDLKTINVSGKLTKNGAMVPNGSNRGNLTFEQADGNAIGMQTFKDTGDATYQGELFTGTYDVVYTPSYYCSSSSPIPCQRLRIRKGVTLNQSGSLDFDVKTVQVSGKLTKNGAVMPDGTNRGSMTFALKDGGALAMPAFKDTGEATYQGELFAGTYDVNYQASYYCSATTVMPCQSANLRRDVGLTVSGALDFDAKTVQVSGKLTKNGQVMPDGTNRGSVTFVEKGGSSRAMPSFKDSGEATYQGELFAGAYSIFYNPSYYCSTMTTMPCQTNLLVGCPSGE